jgi:hypothetical protein
MLGGGHCGEICSLAKMRHDLIGDMFHHPRLGQVDNRVITNRSEIRGVKRACKCLRKLIQPCHSIMNYRLVYQI